MILNPSLIPQALRKRQWAQLADLAQVLQAGIPADLAQTDPTRFQMWMRGLTYCYLIGWHRLNSSALRSLQKKEATKQTRNSDAMRD